MKKASVFVCLLLLSFAVVPASLFAQKGEIQPYAGYYWPGSFNEENDLGEFRNNQLLGVRGGYYITPNFELGGNYAWSNHFAPKDSNLASNFAGDIGFPQGRSRANIWELEFTYNFGETRALGSNFRPYLVAGFGGLTTKVKSDDDTLRASCALIGSDSRCFVLNTRLVGVVNNNNNNNNNILVDSITGTRSVVVNGTRTVFAPNDVIDSGDTYFTFSYGGGAKIHRVWGPMGFFGDFRFRTMPNFFGHGNTWPELSAGLTFSWGE